MSSKVLKDGSRQLNSGVDRSRKIEGTGCCGVKVIIFVFGMLERFPTHLNCKRVKRHQNKLLKQDGALKGARVQSPVADETSLRLYFLSG